MIERTPVWDDRTLHGWRMARMRVANDYSWDLAEAQAAQDPLAAALAEIGKQFDEDSAAVWAAVLAAHVQRPDGLTEEFVLAAASKHVQTYDGWEVLLQEYLDEHHGKFELKYTSKEWCQTAAKDLSDANPTWIDSAHFKFGDQASVYVFNPVDEA